VAFEVVKKKAFALREPLPEDAISIQKSGMATLRVGPLAMVGVSDRCIALADSELMRVGIRRPHEDEAELGFTVQVLRNKGGRDTGRRHVNLAPAIRRLGVEPREVAGRYRLMSVDQMLFVTFTDQSRGDRVREAARQKRAAEVAKQKDRK